MKNVFCNSILIVLIFIGFVFPSHAQDDPLKTLVSTLQKYQYDRPYEKVHLHMDKPYYTIGDNIWFKAYVVQAEKNHPSNLSKILYAELINDRDSVVQILRLPIVVGLSWGTFPLTESLKEGNYRVRAYTNWMRNFGPDFFYDKTIPIGNAITSHIITNAAYSFSKEGGLHQLTADLSFTDLDGNVLSDKELAYDLMNEGTVPFKGTGKTNEKGNIRLAFTNRDLSAIKLGNINTTLKLDDKRSVNHRFPIKSASADTDIQFFPEGGDLVAGVRSTVAFKASSPEGLAGLARGYLVDGDNNEVAVFNAGSRGVGTFIIRPALGNAYKAILKFTDGSELTFPLPEIKPEGYVLSVMNTGEENLRVNVSASAKFADEEMTLIAQSNNKIHLVSKNKLTGSRFSVSIPKKRFPQGILQLTLLTSKNEPVAERLVFINHNESLKINIKGNQQAFLPKGKVELSLNVTDKDNKPVLGSFSIAVIDETKVPYDENKEMTILSNLLLTSDLKGYIHQPNYFFTNIDSTKVKELDMLMLTQGWRRFIWKDVINPAPLAYQPEQSISIGGKVTQGGKPVVKGKILLFYMDEKPFNRDTLTDEQGRFSFNDLYFTDGTKLVLQATNARDNKHVKVELDQMPPELITRNKNNADIEVNVNRSMIAYLKNSAVQYDSLRRIASSSIMLDEVKVVEKKVDFSNSRNMNGPGVADATITGDRLEAFCKGDLSQCLQGLLTGVVMVNGIPYLNRSLYSSFNLPTHMLVLIDGAEADPGDLAYLNAVDVEFIEVLKSAINTSMYGTRGVGGVLLITMKRGAVRVDKRPSYTPGLAHFYVRGFPKTREFYSPNYADPQVNSLAPDLRTTIYWNPNLVTNEQGKTNAQFFNAGSAGTYKVVIEGIDGYGNIGRSVYRYTVK